MAASTAELTDALRRHRVQAEACGVALLLFAASILVGVAAKRRAAPVALDLARATSQLAEIGAFRGAFRPSSPAEDARQAAVFDSLSIGTPHDLRMSLIEDVATIAEDAGLRNVRVTFAGADSAAPAPRPELSGVDVANVKVADYTIALECTGAFGAMLTAIRALPRTVAVEQIVAQRAATGEGYRVVLAVYESAKAAGGSPRG